MSRFLKLNEELANELADGEDYWWTIVYPPKDKGPLAAVGFQPGEIPSHVLDQLKTGIYIAFQRKGRLCFRKRRWLMPPPPATAWPSETKSRVTFWPHVAKSVDGAALSQEQSEKLDQYRRLSTGGHLILGKAGAGKTALRSAVSGMRQTIPSLVDRIRTIWVREPERGADLGDMEAREAIANSLYNRLFVEANHDSVVLMFVDSISEDFIIGGNPGPSGIPRSPWIPIFDFGRIAHLADVALVIIMNPNTTNERAFAEIEEIAAGRGISFWKPIGGPEWPKVSGSGAVLPETILNKEGDRIRFNFAVKLRDPEWLRGEFRVSAEYNAYDTVSYGKQSHSLDLERVDVPELYDELLAGEIPEAEEDKPRTEGEYTE